MRLEILAIGLVFFVFAVLDNSVECSPQLTFSTDWSGGRRESGSDDFDLESNSDSKLTNLMQE